MKLAKYLSDKEITQAAFALSLGIPQATINRYVRGDRFPGPAMIERIFIATGKKVSVTDWYEQAAETRAAKAAEQPTPKIPVQA